MSPRGALLSTFACSAAVLLAGCSTPKERATQIVSAFTPGHVRPIVACWEKEYEAGGFRGEYVATIDFDVTSSEKFANAHVKDIEPTGEGETGRDLGTFRECLETAFAAVELPKDADADGPGYSSFVNVSIHGYKINFLGDGGEARKRTGGRVLIGPRSDRCQGLYTYDPPRDTSILFTEIGLAKSRADAASGKDRDEHARQLQKTYDLQLELAARLEADLSDGSLPPANRKRLEEARVSAWGDALETGELIDCTPLTKAR